MIDRLFTHFLLWRLVQRFAQELQDRFVGELHLATFDLHALCGPDSLFKHLRQHTECSIEQPTQLAGLCQLVLKVAIPAALGHGVWKRYDEPTPVEGITYISGSRISVGREQEPREGPE